MNILTHTADQNVFRVASEAVYASLGVWAGDDPAPRRRTVR